VETTLRHEPENAFSNLLWGVVKRVLFVTVNLAVEIAATS
jgi:hypothetical protein